MFRMNAMLENSITRDIEFINGYTKMTYVLTGPLVGIARIIANLGKMIVIGLSMMSGKDREKKMETLKGCCADIQRGGLEIIPLYGAGLFVTADTVRSVLPHAVGRS